MRKGNPNKAALNALYSAAHQIHRAIMKRELEIARLNEEIRDLRQNALAPVESLCERRAEAVASQDRGEWVSEPRTREWAD